MLFCFLTKAQLSDADLLPPHRPVEINASVQLYKVYNINTVEETFDIDGYFSYSWRDDRLKFDPVEYQTNEIVYLNDRADDKIENDVWFPELEFINTLGAREVDNKALVIDHDGGVRYTERFHATLKEELEYHRFPFDHQELKIEIEPFIHDEHSVAITNLTFKPATHSGRIESDNWIIVKKDVNLSESMTYVNRNDTLGKNVKLEEHSLHEAVKTFSHVECILEVKRMPGYFLWQLIFPLAIILLASVVVLWIDDFATQIGIGFTLMLTVVAFNFFSETLLPQLPYNTYIEVLIMIGYMFILLSILMVVYLNKLKTIKAGKAEKIRRRLIYMYPLSLFVTMLLTTWFYFGPFLFKILNH